MILRAKVNLCLHIRKIHSCYFPFQTLGAQLDKKGTHSLPSCECPLLGTVRAVLAHSRGQDRDPAELRPDCQGPWPSLLGKNL